MDVAVWGFACFMTIFFFIFFALYTQMYLQIGNHPHSSGTRKEPAYKAKPYLAERPALPLPRPPTKKTPALKYQPSAASPVYDNTPSEPIYQELGTQNTANNTYINANL